MVYGLFGSDTLDHITAVNAAEHLFPDFLTPVFTHLSLIVTDCFPQTRYWV